MPSIKSIEHKLAEETELAEELRVLVAQIIDRKRFDWPLEGMISYPHLAALGVVEAQSASIRTHINDYLAYGFIKYQQPDLLTDTADMNLILDFEKSLHQQFTSDVVPGQLFELINQIERLWIKSQHIDRGDNLLRFGLATVEEKNQRHFAEVFPDVLPDLILSPSIIYEHIQQFVHSQTYLLDLLYAVETYCRRYPAIASELYAYIMQNPFKEDVQWQLAALSGLNRSDHEGFWPRLVTMAQATDESNLSLKVMARADIITDQQANQYIVLAQSISQKNEEAKWRFVTVIQQILRFPQSIETSTTQRCYDLLTMLAQDETEAVQIAVADALWVLDDAQEERFAVFSVLLRNPALTTRLYTGKTNRVDTLLSTAFKGVIMWFEAFDILALERPLAFKEESFSGSLHRLTSHSGEALMSQLLPRLLHKDGHVRRSANRILRYVEQNAPQLRFTADALLALSPLQQYRIWLVVDESFHKPDFALPLLLPLLDSHDELVVELITCQLEIASENYMGKILEILESILQPDNSRHQTILLRVQTHFEAFLEYRRRKSAINELNPLLTQQALFSQFDSMRRMTWSDKMHQGLRTDSLLGLFNEVYLSKGGGWRNSKTGVISQLGHFQSTFSMPRFYFLRSYEMDLDTVIGIWQEEWTDDTDLFTWITAV